MYVFRATNIAHIECALCIFLFVLGPTTLSPVWFFCGGMSLNHLRLQFAVALGFTLCVSVWWLARVMAVFGARLLVARRTESTAVVLQSWYRANLSQYLLTSWSPWVSVLALRYVYIATYFGDGFCAYAVGATMFFQTQFRFWLHFTTRHVCVHFYGVTRSTFGLRHIVVFGYVRAGFGKDRVDEPLLPTHNASQKTDQTAAQSLQQQWHGVPDPNAPKEEPSWDDWY